MADPAPLGAAPKTAKDLALAAALIAKNDAEVIEEALGEGVTREQLSAPLPDGLTFLHVAATSKADRVMQWLVAHGAHLNPVDKQGNTPLHYCASHGATECARVLIARGASLSMRNKPLSRSISTSSSGRRRAESISPHIFDAASAIRRLVASMSSYPVVMVQLRYHYWFSN